MKRQFTPLDSDSEPNKPHLQLVPRIPSRLTDGKDELNFAEFPLSSLSDRPDPTAKTIVFQDTIFDKSRNEYLTRQVTITGSDAHGLPTPSDEEVLLALIQLSKLQGFRHKRVYFKRYQLLQILKWPTSGRSYSRLDLALKRWIGVTLFYKNAWRDRKAHCWTDEGFHMLENVKIVDAQARLSEDEASPCYFEWNEVVFRSFQNGHVKKLDYDFFLSIKGPIAKRLFRFLDKRFFHSSELAFELKTLAYEHIGFSRNTATGDLKRKLSGAIDELAEKGYLQPLPNEKRFIKMGQGDWRVVFIRRNVATIATPERHLVEERAGDLVEALIQFGVREPKADELVRRFPRELVEQKLDIAKWMTEHADSRMSNPAGYLIRSIEEQYEPPRKFTLELADKEHRANQIQRVKVGEERRRIATQRLDAREAAKRHAIDSFLANISPEDRSRIEAEALEQSDAGKRQMLKMGGKVGETARQTILDKHILELLAQG